MITIFFFKYAWVLLEVAIPWALGYVIVVMHNVMCVSSYCLNLFYIQIVAESQKRGESALSDKREKVMLELEKLQR